MAGKRQPIGRLGFVRGSTSHDFLMLAISQGRAKGHVTTADILHVFARFQNQPYRVNAAADVLVDKGYVEKLGDGKWKITAEGEKAVYDMAVRPVRKRESTGRVSRYTV